MIEVSITQRTPRDIGYGNQIPRVCQYEPDASQVPNQLGRSTKRSTRRLCCQRCISCMFVTDPRRHTPPPPVWILSLQGGAILSSFTPIIPISCTLASGLILIVASVLWGLNPGQRTLAGFPHLKFVPQSRTKSSGSRQVPSNPLLQSPPHRPTSNILQSVYSGPYE